MNNLNGKNLKAFQWMNKFGMEPEVTIKSLDNSIDKDEFFGVFIKFLFLGGKAELALSDDFYNNLMDLIGENTPEEGTPNSAMTDEDKGLIQLLFEIEKATN